ncbi:muscarinic acetylcholine receptor M5-like [Patiria miniata]|uniref:G-protein coupled receptors family 1 profile domain-containing protein n=1 Tax=Patiria miniata TaxID=46514 RepID=A0A914AYD6_PATMI|nr:muscarinic acetylcholine receptor M5-like [Patiria miniata]
MQTDREFLYGTNITVDDDWRPNSTTVPTQDGHFTPWFFIRAILGPSVLLVTLIGNLLVIYVFATTRKLRTYTNYYLVGLAVADLVSGGITPALENVSWMLEMWPFGEAVCTINVYINHLFIHATFLMTLTICVDRYRALTRPLRHLREKTIKHALWMISFSYVIPFVIWTPLVIILPYSGVTERVLPPECNGSYGHHFPLLVFAIAVMSWIPMLATITLYIFVFRAVLRGSRNEDRKTRDLCRVSMNTVEGRALREARQIKNDSSWENEDRSNEDQEAAQSSTDDPRQKQITTKIPTMLSTLMCGIENRGYQSNEQENGTELREVIQTIDREVINPDQPAYKSHRRSFGRRLASLRATRTLTYILVVMVVSALPWSIIAFLAVVSPHSTPEVDIFRTMSWLVHLSSAANPFCYAASNPRFKRAFLHVLCCGRRGR